MYTNRFIVLSEPGTPGSVNSKYRQKLVRDLKFKLFKAPGSDSTLRDLFDDACQPIMVIVTELAHRSQPGGCPWQPHGVVDHDALTRPDPFRTCTNSSASSRGYLPLVWPGAFQRS